MLVFSLFSQVLLFELCKKWHWFNFLCLTKAELKLSSTLKVVEHALSMANKQDDENSKQRKI